MNNYAGHRLSPWLGHVMVSRQETARPLLTPGEIMQLPPSDEIVLVSGISPIRTRKARYYEDQQFRDRILGPPALKAPSAAHSGGRRVTQANDWTPLLDQDPDTATDDESATGSLVDHDRANGGLRREPGLPSHEAVVSEEPKCALENGGLADDQEGGTIVDREMEQRFCATARQAALDPDDGLGL
jgi:type IV secretion system protein VirD4